MASFGRRQYNNCKKAKPIVKPPMKSRKKARRVTTLFHKYTREREIAVREGDKLAIQDLDQKIVDIGGREEYQRASQLNTSFHSTSKWVLSYLLHNKNWLAEGIVDDTIDVKGGGTTTSTDRAKRKVKLLEVGAINTVLIEAAEKQYQKTLSVKAIDLRSSHEKIEEIDFFQLEYLHMDPNLRYDAIVCSMVLNCLTTPEERGKMLCLLRNHLRPGGILFLTIPLLCLTQSPYITKERFMNLLEGMGLKVIESKESPKIAFFVLRQSLSLRKEGPSIQVQVIDKTFSSRWGQMVKVRHGKKFRNPFAIVLLDNEELSIVPET
jgi:25S rRNA (adenine2142-N1)-methyltransferase